MIIFRKMTSPFWLNRKTFSKLNIFSLFFVIFLRKDILQKNFPINFFLENFSQEKIFSKNKQTLENLEPKTKQRHKIYFTGKYFQSLNKCPKIRKTYSWKLFSRRQQSLNVCYISASFSFILSPLKWIFHLF